MKKIWSLILTVILALTMCPTSAMAEATSENQAKNEDTAVYWQFQEDTGKLLIYGRGDMGDYSYNAYYRAYKLKQAGWIPWQSYSDVITSLEICEGVTSIGSYAFSGLGELQSVKIADTVRCIGEGAFWECRSIETITIPSSVTEIKDMAFRGCGRLKNVNFNEGLEIIGSEAFNNCVNLNSVVLPSSVKSIASGYTFNNVKNIKFKGNTVPSITAVDIGTGKAYYYELTKLDEQCLYILTAADSKALMNEIKKTEDSEGTDWKLVMYDDSEAEKLCKEVVLKLSSEKIKDGIKVKVSDKSGRLEEIEKLGYKVSYRYYRSKKKDSGYSLMKTSDKRTYKNTKGEKKMRYYYRVEFEVKDGVDDTIFTSKLTDVSPAYRRFK